LTPALFGLDACHTRHPFAHGFELDQLGLHFAHFLGDRVEVLAHEAVALGDLIAHDQAHQRADHGPAFAGRLEEHEVVDGARQTHDQTNHSQRRQHQLPALKVQYPRARQAAVRDEQLHR